MASPTLTHVRPWGVATVDIGITEQTITDVVPAGTADTSGATIDGGGGLALPGFINAYAHVDKSWWGQP